MLSQKKRQRKVFLKDAPEVKFSLFGFVLSILVFCGELASLFVTTGMFPNRFTVLATIFFGVCSFLLLVFSLVFGRFIRRISKSILYRSLMILFFLGGGFIVSAVLAFQIIASSQISTTSPSVSEIITIASTPLATPTITPTVPQVKKVTQNAQNTTNWECEVLDDKTTGCAHPADYQMSTSEELFTAVNEYRKAHGIGVLQKNDLLCNIAQQRANEQVSHGSLDGHAGFEKYARNQTEFDSMAEILYGGIQKQLGVHIVEWGWARSQTGHKEELEEKEWQSGCGGVAGLYAVFIFGKR